MTSQSSSSSLTSASSCSSLTSSSSSGSSAPPPPRTQPPPLPLPGAQQQQQQRPRASSAHVSRFNNSLAKLDCPAWMKGGDQILTSTSSADSRRRHQSCENALEDNNLGGGASSGESWRRRTARPMYRDVISRRSLPRPSSCTSRGQQQQQQRQQRDRFQLSYSHSATNHHYAASNSYWTGHQASTAHGGAATANSGPPATLSLSASNSKASTPATEEQLLPSTSDKSSVSTWSRRRRAYLGWRSSDNLHVDEESSLERQLCPADRLASTSGQLYGNPSGGPKARPSSAFTFHSATTPSGGLQSSSSSSYLPWPATTPTGGAMTTLAAFPATRAFPRFEVHDSIRSVTNAILDLCDEADDDAANGSGPNAPAAAPQPPPPPGVWKESSFLSAKQETRV